MDYKNAFLKTSLHIVEVLAAFGVAYLAVSLFNIPIDGNILGLVLAALAKFQRETGSDYING